MQHFHARANWLIITNLEHVLYARTFTAPTSLTTLGIRLEARHFWPWLFVCELSAARKLHF